MRIIVVSSPSHNLICGLSQISEMILPDDRETGTVHVYQCTRTAEVRPENTSAIIALQRAAVTPMELTKLALLQAVELDVGASSYWSEIAAWEAAHPSPVREPGEAEDTAAMLVDHEYRLTLLELGVEGGEA